MKVRGCGDASMRCTETADYPAGNSEKNPKRAPAALPCPFGSRNLTISSPHDGLGVLIITG